MLDVMECNVICLDSILTQEQPFETTKFVEEVGLMFEMVGLPRMSGRIFGWLLVSDPPYQSNSDLAEVLQASKGSLSTMTRLLIQIGLIERISLPGDRRDYFQIRPNAWSQMTKQRMAQITAFRELAERGLHLMADKAPALQYRLKEMHDMHAFLERELPLLNKRWEREQAEQRRQTLAKQLHPDHLHPDHLHLE